MEAAGTGADTPCDCVGTAEAAPAGMEADGWAPLEKPDAAVTCEARPAWPTDAFAAAGLAAAVGNANAGRAACGSAADVAGCAAADARILGSKKPVAARGRLGCVGAFAFEAGCWLRGVATSSTRVGTVGSRSIAAAGAGTTGLASKRKLSASSSASALCVWRTSAGSLTQPPGG